MKTVDAFGTGTVFHHVGLVVAAIADHCADCEVTHDPLQKVRVAFVDLHGATLELIEPAAPDSPVRASLEKGSKLVHLCYEVPDLERALAAGAEAGFRQLGPPTPAAAFGGRRIAWLMHRTYGLVELLEAAGGGDG